MDMSLLPSSSTVTQRDSATPASRRRHLFPNYRPPAVTFTHGLGSVVYDTHGKDYIDLVAGIATCGLGHCHPKLVAALEAQAQTLWHISNLYDTRAASLLADSLCDTSFADRVFFCNSGTEANEGAIKLARRFHYDRGEKRTEILVCEGGFHGRTLGALSATAQPKYHEGFLPLVPGFRALPYGDADALRAQLTNKTAALLIEPIQGEGGVIVPPPGFLREARALCDAVGALLILDEVQTGMGRTGTLWAHEQEGITPDILTSAKALGGGFPIGAVLAREEVARSFVPGTHGSTYGGNPLATTVAKAVLDVLLEDGVLSRVPEVSRRLGAALADAMPRHLVKQVRGRGLLIGLEVTQPAAELALRALEAGVLVNALGDRVLRFVPPLTLTDSEIDEAAWRLKRAFGA